MVMRTAGRSGKVWSRDETIIALGLYFQLPYGKMDARTPEIISLAKQMGRPPASLSMKLNNLAHIDPTLKKRGIAALAHGAKQERQIWDEFANDQERLSFEYYRLTKGLRSAYRTYDDEEIKTPPGMDGVRLSRYRINQSFFRSSVLSAYDGKCCITGIANAKLLRASHIKPWASCDNGNERTETQNGLCLNALHDCAFDRGLITLDDDCRLVLSPSVKDTMPQDVYEDLFVRYEGRQITLPVRGRPSPMFLSYHRENIFAA